MMKSGAGKESTSAFTGPNPFSKRTITNSWFDYENRLWKFMSRNEIVDYHWEVCERVKQNPRFYLDNLHTLHTYRIPWENYQEKKKSKKLYK